MNLLDELLSATIREVNHSHSTDCGCNKCLNTEWQDNEFFDFLQNWLSGSTSVGSSQLTERQIADAVQYNQKNARRIGWYPHFDAISAKVLKLNISPTEATFARELAKWQAQNGFSGKDVDGKLGPSTWQKIRPLLTSPTTRAGATPTSPSGGSAASSWTARSVDERMRYVMNRLVNQYNYPVNGAAGLVGNLYAESGVLPNRVEGSRMATPMRAADFQGRVRIFTPSEIMNRRAGVSGSKRPGIGLAQWTSRNRRNGLFKHRYNGQVIGANIIFDMDAQIDYLVHELNSRYRAVDRVLRSPNVSINAASDEVVYRFETPGSVLTKTSPRRLLPRDHPQVQAVFGERRAHSQRAWTAYLQSP